MESSLGVSGDNPVSGWLGPIIFQDNGKGILIRMVLIILITVILTRIFSALWKKWQKQNEAKIQHRFLYNVIQIIIYVIAIIACILQVDKNGTILTALISGSGFITLAVGLAAQESLGNIFNGMVLSISKPFEVGDRIHLVNGKITGYVEDITLRHTVMRTFVNSRIIIPNSTINKDMIENSNYEMSHASAFIDVIITHDSDMDRAMEIMADIVGNHPMFLDRRKSYEMDKKPKVTVYVRELGINGIELRTSMWTTNVNDNFDACSDARYAIKKAFDAEGILLAQIPARPVEYARAGAIPSESGNYPEPVRISGVPPDESGDNYRKDMQNT